MYSYRRRQEQELSIDTTHGSPPLPLDSTLKGLCREMYTFYGL